MTVMRNTRSICVKSAEERCKFVSVELVSNQKNHFKHRSIYQHKYGVLFQDNNDIQSCPTCSHRQELSLGITQKPNKQVSHQVPSTSNEFHDNLNDTESTEQMHLLHGNEPIHSSTSTGKIASPKSPAIPLEEDDINVYMTHAFLPWPEVDDLDNDDTSLQTPLGYEQPSSSTPVKHQNTSDIATSPILNHLIMKTPQKLKLTSDFATSPIVFASEKNNISIVKNV